MSFQANLSAHAGDATRIMAELRGTLRELGVQTNGVGDVLRADWTPGSYEPMSYRFWAPEGLGLIAIEGLLLELSGDPSEGLRLALNHLNVELESLRYYTAGNRVFVRTDLLPYTEKSKWINPRELKLALTTVCAQNALFKDTLEGIQRGRSWTAVKDAVKSFR